jgi:signal transduction histidine kinase
VHYDRINKKLAALSQQIKDLNSQNTALRLEGELKTEILNNTLHEIRKFSAQISKFCEKISRDTPESNPLHNTAQSAFYTAGMISSRLAYTDIELNPNAIENQTTVRSGIFRKFDKAKRILAEEAKNRAVDLRLTGESRTYIEALPIFELLPFVILENAIKYSPREQDVQINFDNINGRELVTVSSVGPDVANEELPRLFDKGFRGALTKSMPGEGLGLFLAKRVCDFHGFKICAKTGTRNKYQLYGVAYSDFIIEIQF